MSIKTLDELLAEGVEGRGVLVRSDLNVPLDENGNITDPGRIIASVPTLRCTRLRPLLQSAAARRRRR